MAGSSMNFSAATRTMRTVAPVFSAAPRIWAMLSAHVGRRFARKIRSASRVSPEITQRYGARRSSPASAAAQNSAGICTAACSDQKLSASVPLVRTASVNAVPRRIATEAFSQPGIGSWRTVDLVRAPPMCCGSKV